MDTSLRVAFGPAIAAAAERHHLDPRLLAAVAAQETGGPGRDSGRNIVGDGGHGHGLFQIDDRWHPFARTPFAMDPASNADYAAGLIAGNLRRYGDVRAALSAYNAGSPAAIGSRTDWGDGKPVGYADSVLRHFRRLGGAEPGSAPGAPAAAGADPRDDADRVDGLRVAAARVGLEAAPQFGAASGSMAAPATAALFTPSLPQRTPLPRIDEHDQRDLAPEAYAGPADAA